MCETTEHQRCLSGEHELAARVCTPAEALCSAEPKYMGRSRICDISYCELADRRSKQDENRKDYHEKPNQSVRGITLPSSA